MVRLHDSGDPGTVYFIENIQYTLMPEIAFRNFRHRKKRFYTFMASPKIPWQRLWKRLWQMIPDPFTLRRKKIDNPSGHGR
jgi:hypothetical protein